MKRLTLFTLKLFLVPVTTLTSSGETVQAQAPAPTAAALGPFTEAPADFDDKTNDPAFVSQSDFEKAKTKFFEKVDEIKDGLGPVYGAVAICVGICLAQSPVERGYWIRQRGQSAR
jgi:hypothetical protein